MTGYQQKIVEELSQWQKKMLHRPTIVNRLTKKIQDKINGWIPDKIHQAITTAIKQMVRGVLFGATHTTSISNGNIGIEQTEEKVLERISFYKTTAAAEGGITGAGGFILALADFPILLTLKMKMLFDIASIYGYDVDDYRERVYILYIFQLAFSTQAQRTKVYLQMNNWENQKQNLPDDIHQFDWRTFQQQYRDYIDLAKLAQLIPVIGAAVGVVVNYRLIKKLGVTAMNAYRMRWHQQTANI